MELIKLILMKIIKKMDNSIYNKRNQYSTVHDEKNYNLPTFGGRKDAREKLSFY